MEYIIESIQYVSSAPLFWGSMGFTTALAMFFGAIIYNGDIPTAKKGIISILTYAFMIAWVNLSRASAVLSPQESNVIVLPGIAKLSQAISGTITTLFVTFFWVLGVIIGIKVFCFKNKRCKKE